MKIYADVLFLINLVSSYLLLALTARITHRYAKQWRQLSAAALGAFLAVIGFCAGDCAAAAKIASSLLLPPAAFGFNGTDTVRQIIVFSLLSVLFAGVFALIGGSSHAVVIRGGIMYFDLPAVRFLTVFAVSYAVISVSERFIKRRAAAKYHCIKIVLNGKAVYLTALVDSGNVLKEAVTGRSVIIAEWDKIDTLFERVGYDDWVRGCEKYRLWPIPYRSLGNSNGLVYAFAPDEVIITEEKRRLGKVFVGVTNEKLSMKDEYDAIIGASV